MKTSNSGSNLAKASSGSSSIHTEGKNSDFNSHHQTHSTVDTFSENFSSFMNYGKKCYICEKNFFMRKKNLCKLCNNYVCCDHFNKIRNEEKVCDFCDKKEARKLVKQEIENEIQILAFELDKSKEMTNRTHREYCQKLTDFHKCEEEFTRIMDLMDSRKKMALGRIENEKFRTQKNAEMMTANKKAIEEAVISEKEMNFKYEGVQKQLLQISTEILTLKNETQQLSKDLSEKTNSDKKTKSFILSKLCGKCTESVSKVFTS